MRSGKDFSNVISEVISRMYKISQKSLEELHMNTKPGLWLETSDGGQLKLLFIMENNWQGRNTKKKEQRDLLQCDNERRMGEPMFT